MIRQSIIGDNTAGKITTYDRAKFRFTKTRLAVFLSLKYQVKLLKLPYIISLAHKGPFTITEEDFSNL